jgi:CubicO group peptidase (beta-lactamase class C family)
MAATHPDDVLTEAEVARLPSVVGVCFVGGRVCWTGGAGRHAAITGRPASPGDQYRIGSITKTMTAAAVLQLRDAGRLDLADPASRHVPDAPFGDHPLRALLAHSSGMPAEPAGAWWERERGTGREVLWGRNRDRADVFAAGERFHYSNLAFALLGAVVEQVSGVGWMEYVTERLLVPLEMGTTTYHPTDRAAEGTSRTPDGRLVPEPASCGARSATWPDGAPSSPRVPLGCSIAAPWSRCRRCSPVTPHPSMRAGMDSANGCCGRPAGRWSGTAARCRDSWLTCRSTRGPGPGPPCS